MMTGSTLIKSNQNIIIAVILAFLLLATGVTDQTMAQGLADPRFDLTDNGVIDDADAAMVLDAMAILQETGLCISSELANHDMNGDGCVDIFDAQIVLSHWGERTRPEPPSAPIGPAAVTFTVNSNGSSSDQNKGNGTCDTGGTVTVNGNSSNECTLRAAIQESNNLNGPETINFNIRNSDGSCPSSVNIDNVSNDLVIDAPDDAGVLIDGYSQCGASPNTNTIEGNAVIKIEIKGPGTDGSKGLTIFSGKNTIKGLAIYRSKENVWIQGPDAKNNTIQGNILGSNASVTWASYGKALSLRYRSSYNLIGGVAPKERNIIAGFNGDGIPIRDNHVNFNVIINNYFGLKQNGKSKAQSKGDGFDIQDGPAYNWVGASPPGWIAPGANSVSAANWPPPGATWPPVGWQIGDPLPSPDPNRVYDPRERNVIGFSSDGIELTHGSQYNYLMNNYIGVSASGTVAVGNSAQGINLEDRIDHQFIYNNVIVNNQQSGIRGIILSDYHEIVNNYIGVAPDGITPMGNGTNINENERYGIDFYGGSQHNLIKNNIIANQPKAGIHLSADKAWQEFSTNETYFNTITQNSIYNNGSPELNAKGIQLVSDDGYDANQGILKPIITSASQVLVQGTACSACTVEVFIAYINDNKDLTDGGEGKTYLATGATDGSGNFAIPISGVNLGQKVTSTATDALGNTSEFSNNVEVTDGQIPVGGVLLNGGINLQSIYTDVLASFWAVDNVSITGWKYRVDNPDLSGIAWTAAPGGSPFETEINPLSLSYGFHTIYAQYKDNQGNQSGVYNASITIVNIGNPGTIPNGAITINNGDPYTNNPTLSLKLASPNPPFYTKDMEVGETSGSLDGSSWESYVAQTNWTLGNPPNQSQTVSMYARFRDVDDVETSIVSDNILYDPITPTVSVSIDPVTKIMNLSGSQDDAGGSGLGQMRIFDGTHDSGWLAYQTSYTWPGSEGTIIKVQLRDNAGNTSAASSIPFAPDGKPVGSVLLDGGTGLQSANNDVEAQFDAQDDNQVKKWRYSVDSDINGASWTTIGSPGPTFSKTKILSLQNGFHTVYAQYQDDNGQISPVYFATILIGDPVNNIYLPIIFGSP